MDNEEIQKILKFLRTEWPRAGWKLLQQGSGTNPRIVIEDEDTTMFLTIVSFEKFYWASLSLAQGLLDPDTTLLAEDSHASFEKAIEGVIEKSLTKFNDVLFRMEFVFRSLEPGQTWEI